MKTCLIVDDSRMIRRVAGRIVKDLGFETVDASNAAMSTASSRRSPQARTNIL